MTNQIKPRLYYDNPIQALWMQKEFNVEFELQEVKVGILESFKSHPFMTSDAGDKFSVEFAPLLGDRIYVTEESLPIFDVQKGDLINYESRSGKNQITATYLESFIQEGEKRWGLQSHGMNSPKIYRIDQRPFSIIMRQGKHFFQPKQE